MEALICRDLPSQNLSEISLNDKISWDKVSEKLRNSYGDAIYKSWILPLEFGGIDNGKAVIYTSTRFMKDWVNNHYLETIRRFWQLENNKIHAIELVVKNDNHAIKTPITPNITNNKINKFTSSYNFVEETETVSAKLDPRFTFENFVVGKPNELAYSAAKRVAESKNAVQGCNPLFLYGGVGLGKTHLMQAVAWHIHQNNPTRRVLYLSAEKFMYQFIRALRFNEAIAFKDQFRSVDVLMVDDVQFISGKNSTQEEFFHTFNALVEQSKQLVISADRSPSDLEGLEERIRSRLGWGLVADINDTSYELRLGILQSKIDKIENIYIPQSVLEFLAGRITSNIRELEGALNRVVAHATFVGGEVTVESTGEILKDLLRANDKKVTIEDIQKIVANHYNIKISDMFSNKRSVAIARPRQIAMYLSKNFTMKSLPEIGRKFGGKDHTTVMHAVKRVNELCQKDAEIEEDLELLKRLVQN